MRDQDETTEQEKVWFGVFFANEMGAVDVAIMPHPLGDMQVTILYLINSHNTLKEKLGLHHIITHAEHITLGEKQVQKDEALRILKDAKIYYIDVRIGKDPVSAEPA